MKEVRLNELNAWKSVFIASEKGHSWALCALRVDDGLLVGNDQDPKFVALRERINQQFNIEEWQLLTEEKPLNFLGVELRQEKDGLSDRMDKYTSDRLTPKPPDL